MFTPRFQCVARQASRRTSQCFRQQRLDAMRRNPISHQMRQQRCQSSFEQPKKPSAFRLLFRAHPFSMTLACLSILAGATALLYTNYFYHSYIIGAFHKFPEPVAKQMRKALYYTNISLEPKNAIKYYREALRVADEIGMDPFSDEIIGVKIQVAALMERVQQYQKAIDILEIVKSDNLKWMEQLGDKPGNEGKRTRVLTWTVKVSVKLGDLYACPYILETEKAEEMLVWAVETAMKEQKRRDEEGVKPGEGEWLSDEEHGASLEALAHHYEELDHHYLAAPLFLQAITLSKPVSCHTTVLMNNLSISLAQQLPPPSEKSTATRAQLVSNASLWAEKAIAVSTNIAPPERTEECDISCAVATHNLGEFAEMLGDVKGAMQKFNEAKSLARAVGFQEGVINSEKALKRLEKVVTRT
ncbi:TPR repeat-containing protein P27G11.02 [Lachnellula suecica]|uniref:TPR repeat-containing protein P27G11.02 n=1 Tax=Lachnellula suecica TaxID=602035 RepID=A0A8T9CK42_9HELO|nr:TPR repeat-containing protein P27G11.02 [Lachnellula suecica]